MAEPTPKDEAWRIADSCQTGVLYIESEVESAADAIRAYGRACHKAGQEAAKQHCVKALRYEGVDTPLEQDEYWEKAADFLAALPVGEVPTMSDEPEAVLTKLGTQRLAEANDLAAKLAAAEKRVQALQTILQEAADNMMLADGAPLDLPPRIDAALKG